MILCWGVNHAVASVAQRELVAVPKGLLARWVLTCRDAGLAEVVILSTCNRTEVYAVTPHASADAARALLQQALARCAPEAVAVWREVGYWHVGYAALTHLFRVASSLDALVVGEPQILGQVKQAYEAACAVGAVGPQLHPLFQRAFRVAKRVREQTGLGERPVSVGSVAVALATQLFGPLTSCRALVLGSGELGETLAQSLQAAEIGDLAISGRNGERLSTMAQRHHAAEIPWQEWPERLSALDIVICCTAATEPVITVDRMAPACRSREQRPLFLIDLALPRNIDPACATCPHVYLYDLDDLRAIAAENLDARRSAVVAAEAMVCDMAQAAWKAAQPDRHEVVSSLHQKCEAIRQGEVARTLRDLGAQDPAVAQAMHRCTQAIVAKMLHDPILCVKAEEPPPVEWLRRLFRLA